MNFRLTARLKIKLTKVFWITLIWTIIGILETLYIHVLSFDFPSLQRTESYDFYKYLRLYTISIFFGGMIAGFILVFFLRGRFRHKSYGISVFLNTLILVLILMVLIGLGVSIYDSKIMGFSFFTLSRMLGFYGSYFFLKTLVFWLIIIFLTNLVLDVDEKYGVGVLRNLIMGKYHHPREEERIFMFLDMKGSTTIAEKIGHIQFFELLNDFFRDITDPILFSNGNIYQYIGDEVVIFWKMKRGIKNANCIRCYYNIREAISYKKDYYLANYGVMPEFKAGLHCGKVTIGEIGVLKRDIVFSGDVLNTTARIQSLCNEYGVKILASKLLLDKIPLPPDSIETRKIGDISLKGKTKKVVLYTIVEGLTQV